jgi:hypothetical protein
MPSREEPPKEMLTIKELHKTAPGNRHLIRIGVEVSKSKSPLGIGSDCPFRRIRVIQALQGYDSSGDRGVGTPV